MTSDQALIMSLSQEVADLKHKVAQLCDVVSAVDEASVANAKGVLALSSTMQRYDEKLKITEQRFWGDAL